MAPATFFERMKASAAPCTPSAPESRSFLAQSPFSRPAVSLSTDSPPLINSSSISSSNRQQITDTPQQTKSLEPVVQQITPGMAAEAPKRAARQTWTFNRDFTPVKTTEDISAEQQVCSTTTSPSLHLQGQTPSTPTFGVHPSKKPFNFDLKGINFEPAPGSPSIPSPTKRLHSESFIKEEPKRVRFESPPARTIIQRSESSGITLVARDGSGVTIDDAPDLTSDAGSETEKDEQGAKQEAEQDLKPEKPSKETIEPAARLTGSASNVELTSLLQDAFEADQTSQRQAINSAVQAALDTAMKTAAPQAAATNTLLRQLVDTVQDLVARVTVLEASIATSPHDSVITTPTSSATPTPTTPKVERPSDRDTTGYASDVSSLSQKFSTLRSETSAHESLTDLDDETDSSISSEASYSPKKADMLLLTLMFGQRKILLTAEESTTIKDLARSLFDKAGMAPRPVEAFVGMTPLSMKWTLADADVMDGDVIIFK